MDEHTLQVLEFDKVIEKVAGFASSDLGKEAVRALDPSPLPRVVHSRQGETAEVRKLLELTSRFPLDGVHDVRPALEQAHAEGAMLDGIDLFEIGQTLRAAATLKEFIAKQKDYYDHLERVARTIEDLSDLADAIAATVDDTGRVLDSASPALADIRKQIVRAEASIRRRLKRVVEEQDVRECLQDDYVTLREGRYVLPVLAHRKNDVRGIVHDRSDTGQTVFIEPQAVVEVGNEIRDLFARERVEVRRTLRELTARVRADMAGIESNLQALAAADCIYARARFGIHYRLSAPQFGDERELEVYDARHPMLLFAGVDAVPISYHLTPSTRVVVISGPNAGGKTVALKTVGLLALMAQTGLPVPASEASKLWVFADVLADVGDEQSIEQALSTFSAHAARLADILGRADANTLVLVDELGRATDPQEGSALACAVLDEIYETDALAVVTTHLHEPKTMAHEYPAMENASVQFDVDTLQPTYKLTVGLPGSSHAFDIAGRMGMPEAVLAKAKARVGEGPANIEQLLASIQEHDQRLAAERTRAEAARVDAEELEAKYKQAMANAKKDAREALRNANLEADRVLLEAQREAEALIAHVREEAKARGGKEVPSDVVARVRRRSRSRREKHRQEADRLAEGQPDRLTLEDVRPGMDVLVLSLHKTGRVVSVKKSKARATVAVGATQFDLKIEDLAHAQPQDREPAPGSTPRTLSRAADVDPRLVLIGMRAEQARAELERYLELACLGDHPEVCIVHGYGTGALRKVTREVLSAHPLVDSFRPGEQGEGSAGATIVRFV